MEKTKENLVSIIIPVYNAEKYITRCINSILNQDYSNYEIVLVNDGSSKQCETLLHQLAEKHKCIKLIDQKNQGVSVARNNGLKSSSGEWVVFIDADDYIAEDYLSTMIDNAQKYSADIVVSEYFTCIGQQKSHSKFLNDCTIKCYGKENKVNLVKSCIESRTYGCAQGPTNIGVPWAKLYKRTAVSEVKFDSRLTHMEDTIFNINVLMCADKIVYVPKPLYYYEIHMDSAVHSVQKNFELIAQCVVECLFEFETKYQLKKELHDAINYKMFCLYYQCIKSQYIRNLEMKPYETIHNMRRISKTYKWDGKIHKDIYAFCTTAQKIYGILARLNCFELLYIALKFAETRNNS